MLIEVGDDIISRAKNDDPVAINVLEQLADAYRFNKHIIYLSYKQLDSVYKIKNLNSFYKSIYERLHNNMASFIGPLKTKITFSAIISYADPNNPNQLWVNPASHNVMELYKETHLLVENLLDADFYDYVVLYYQNGNKVKRDCNICYYALQGGGDTIKDVYKREIKLGKHFCLAIVDSDKKYPDGECGQTSKGLESIHAAEIPFNCRYYRMQDVSEIENLIPISVIKLCGNLASNSVFKYNLPLEFFSFVDMKKGFAFCDINNDRMYNYFGNFFSTNAKLREDFKICVECISDNNNRYCINEDIRNKCRKITFVMRPFGANLLANLLNNKNCIAKFKNIKMWDLSSEQQKEWNEIGKMIFEWCCCAKRTLRV